MDGRDFFRRGDRISRHTGRFERGDNNRACAPSRVTPLLLLIASPNKRKASTLSVLAFGAHSAAGRPARMTAGLVVAAMSGTPSTLAGYAPPASINGLRRNASPVSSGRHTRIGTRNDLLILALDGQATVTLNPKPGFGFTAAAEAIRLPKTKPQALRVDFVVPSIRSREVARAHGLLSGAAKMRSPHSTSAIVCSASIPCQYPT